MTRTEIVMKVANDLNLTSQDALDRIANHVNDKYQELLTKPWLQISRRGEVVQPCTIGNQYVTFPVTKLYSVFDPVNLPGEALTEVSFNELRQSFPTDGPPALAYAVARQTDRTIVIMLDCIPRHALSLHADAERRLVTLGPDDMPQFNEDFHLILYYGAKNLELLKMEKSDLAAEANAMWESKISDLKYHIAKTSFLNYLQGKSKGDYPAVNTIIQG